MNMSLLWRSTQWKI